jgi:Cof subfamily protein (haloacid dehalogenase superfamily)
MNLPKFTKLPGAVAIDLDGTLLNSKTQLSVRNRAALEKCIEGGIPVIIATGRPTRSVKRLLGDELAHRCSLVVMNGALAAGNPPLSGTFRGTLTEEMVRGIINTALQYDQCTRISIEIDGYEFATTLDGYDFTKKGCLDKETLWQRHSATSEMVFTMDEAIKRNPCKIALGQTDILRLAEILEKQFGRALSIICSDITGIVRNPLLNITAKTATKPEALRRLLTTNGISLDDTIAFGDDIPDLEMLQACGMPVAMANAFPEIKAICVYQTAGNDEDGVAVVLEKMLEEIGI